MKRLIDWNLKQWKSDTYKKPLLIRGARQVGKTYAIRNLGKSFEDFVEVNFELNRQAVQIFEKDLNPRRIILELSLLTNKKIEAGKTLLFLDEIQQAPQAILALRYFYEMIPELHVIAAGSLLDFAIETIGLPVGRISTLYLYPLSFIEFLAATGHQLLAKQIIQQKIDTPFTDVIHDKALDLLGQYLAIGGMPEACSRWVTSQDPRESFKVQHEILEAYRVDFQKYAKKNELECVSILFDQIPHFIGDQFQYKNIHGEYRKRELAPCINLLCKANVIHKIHHTAANGLPLGAEINLEWFKLIFLDIALCQSVLNMDLANWFLDPKAQFVNRGAIIESFIGQELLCYAQPFKHQDLYFWKRASKNSQAEVDYIYEHEGKIIPIEVKSGTTGQLKSMHIFLEEHIESPYGVRFSMQNYSKIEKIESRPLYAAVSLAHKDQLKSLNDLLD